MPVLHSAKGTSTEVANSRRQRLIIASALVLLALCGFMRFYRLGSVPGINGDEAWLGVAVNNWWAGREASLQTPTGNIINPFYILTEGPLAAILGPHLAILRLPAALWNIVGLGLFWFFYRRFVNSREALLATLTMACLPIHLCHSRLGWDSSFIFVVAPLMLLLVFKAAEAGWTWGRIALMVALSLLSLWIHMTMLFFLGLIGVSLWFVNLRKALGKPAAERRHGIHHAMMVPTVLVPVLGFIFFVLTQISHRSASELAADFSRPALELFSDKYAVLMELRHQAIVLSGQRAFEYFAGKPMVGMAIVWSAVCLVAFVMGAVALLKFSRRPMDWCVSVIALAAVPIVVVLRGIFHTGSTGSERYILWYAPVFAIILTRVTMLGGTRLREFGAAALILFAAANLSMTSRDYFRSIARMDHIATLHYTFWTGPEEPKAVAARIIAEVAAREPIKAVYTADWWIDHPLRYLLGEKVNVLNACFVQMPQTVTGPSIVLVGYYNGPFIEKCLKHYADKNLPSEHFDIYGGHGKPILSVFVIRKAKESEPSS